MKLADIVYSPSRAVNSALHTIERRKAERGGFITNLPSMDKIFHPLAPGEFVVVLGKTSNYKTGFMQYLARTFAAQLGDRDDAAVVYVTWEQAVEEMIALDLANNSGLPLASLAYGRVTDDDIAALRGVAVRRSILPIYIIGHSIDAGRERPPLTMSLVGKALEYMQDEYGITPVAVFLDYLQQVEPEDGRMERRMAIFHAVHAAKDMALRFACPVIAGVQAGRQVYDRAWGVPTISDGLESSNIEHTADRGLGIWYPCTQYAEGTQVETNNPNIKPFVVTRDILIVSVLKQRFGRANVTFRFHVNPSSGDIWEEQGDNEGAI